VKIVLPPGSVYEKVPTAVMDANFRLPGIESALKEKG
jgi:hypothetical protein